MTLPAKARGWLLGGALALTLLAMYWVDSRQADDAPATASAQPLAGQTATPAAGRLPARLAETPSVTHGTVAGYAALPDLLQRRHALARLAGADDQARQADLLKAHAWYVPPAVVSSAAHAAPVAPVTPAVPYQYMGKLEDTPDGTLIFLTVRNKVQTVRLGQTVDSLWRLDREDANALYLSYLPLATTQVLAKSARRNAAATAPAAADGVAND